MFASRKAFGSWDDGLDEAQLATATHGDSPLVVVAGAGTGKTRALTARVACLLERSTSPERILLLTFTRRAADDMLSRAAALVGLRGGQRPRGGTFHAVAHYYVRAYAGPLGLTEGLGVLDPPEASDLMDLLRGQVALTGTDVRFPRSHILVEIYSRSVNSGVPIRDLLPAEYPWCEPHIDAIAELFRAFTARKRAAGLLDYDDLLLFWRALLGHPELGPQLAQQFDYVLVDEYQDVNTLQVEIVRLLAPDGEGLTVVGDEAQSIYGFRGADSRHLREFVCGLPESTIIRLEHNYRSHQGILDVANVVRKEEGPDIHLVSERNCAVIKPSWTRCHDASSEARAVVTRVLDAQEAGRPLREQAVLVRAGHHSDLIELELSARKVPYRKYGGLRFLEAAHVKDFVTAARVLDNPRDEVAWYRILRLHPHIAPARARALIGSVEARAGDILCSWPDVVAKVPPPARSALSATLDALAKARQEQAAGVRAGAVLDAIRPILRDRYRDFQSRLHDLERLVAAAGKAADLPRWVAELTLDPPRSTGDNAGPPHLDEDYVIISTIHSAKGLEWPVVHIPHVIEGAIPVDMALGAPGGLEEERRLFYVAITRAQDELHLYSPLRMPYHRYAMNDRHGYAAASRFLDDTVTPLLRIEEELPNRSVAQVSTQSTHRVVVDLETLWS
ncbi:MAG TPA: ATP-dependent helicase [Acidimicrobiales bacterium]|nr:ATP-dependent helicase [Acidimicrobiales bacterium]